MARPLPMTTCSTRETPHGRVPSALILAACSVFGTAAFADAGLPVASDLSLKEIFKLPIGSLGLEPTQKVRSLAGKRVRLFGYMVHEESPVNGRMLLAPLPVQLSEVADGPADDLPPATVFVHLPPQDALRRVAHRPGLWVLEGILEVGDREESDGRISYLRLLLDSHDAESGPSTRKSTT